jgi:hypothetical protein
MYIVIQSSISGAQAPHIFAHREDAIFHKRCLAISEAYVTTLGQEFTKTMQFHQLSLVPTIFDKIARFVPEDEWDPAEMQIVEEFERFLVSHKACFTEYTDLIVDPVYNYVYFQVFEVRSPSEQETSAGFASANAYDDGCAKGIHIRLDNEIVCSLDVLEPQKNAEEGEARVLVYKKEYAADDEEAPIACIAINK